MIKPRPARPAPKPSCNIVFEKPYGKSKCESCGREWEIPMRGSMYDCYRELGPTLVIARELLREALENKTGWQDRVKDYLR